MRDIYQYMCVWCLNCLEKLVLKWLRVLIWSDYLLYPPWSLIYLCGVGCESGLGSGIGSKEALKGILSCIFCYHRLAYLTGSNLIPCFSYRPHSIWVYFPSKIMVCWHWVISNIKVSVIFIFWDKVRVLGIEIWGDLVSAWHGEETVLSPYFFPSRINWFDSFKNLYKIILSYFV